MSMDCSVNIWINEIKSACDLQDQQFLITQKLALVRLLWASQASYHQPNLPHL